MFNHPEYDNHERVAFCREPEVGLTAIIAVHDTALGPAFGGCRMWPYEDEGAALTDVLRLSRGMTYKAAICQLPYGGGKSVIIGDPQRDKTPDLLRAMGRLVEGLGGAYIIADDVGTTLDDLAVMRRETSHTAATTASAREPLAVTAYGVLRALETAAEVELGRSDLAGLTVAVQGLGNVGLPLCRYLRERGAELTVADVDADRVATAEREVQATAVAPEAIYRQPVDVFAPCALGGILNDGTIPHLAARIVCGGANNQLLSPSHDAALAARGIVYVPDYLANAGGVIDFHQESIDDSAGAVLAAVARIGDITRDVLAQASAAGETPLAIANRLVRRRLAAARP
ncbi:MAG: Glu/Leu/Phe/Val dehydrogenase dimerization domain-containing protein [Alphaproteobacteria bacterium]|jgi:leucine dehydrogenase|nr:Glu/Leu/Phe/Val dehydrogenase dimerization domain-containing protein [Alphaproteobacteria bacterium]MDP6815201.1 Glu/Leu/Phe/Val dehydrogenase dimerization domain-containing protein [Alphaproteobacteria bacterium]